MRRRLDGLVAARAAMRDLWRSGRSIGSVHTLGALHDGHARVIALAARENDEVVVSVYPNRAQLAPGTRYRHDVDRDVALAFDHGATNVITTNDAEAYPPEFGTFLDQGDRTQRLDGTVVPFLFRGMITMCIRWMNFVRPTRAYWGLKDIGQTLLVRRALADLWIDTEVREVPCVRFRSGVPISSRLLDLDRESLAEVASVYRALDAGRAAIAAGERSSARVIAAMTDALALRKFRVLYVKLAEPAQFHEPEVVPDGDVVLHIVVTNGTINHFDGFLLRSDDDRRSGPEWIWLADEWPGGGR
ncbi:MAG TPA: pantoate--beta-alanine ligase [Nannocystaceae bacterium]|nr:pantoate--beta-alanine ligase [Nannocystaceae bacterium]